MELPAIRIDPVGQVLIDRPGTVEDAALVVGSYELFVARWVAVERADVRCAIQYIGSRAVDAYVNPPRVVVILLPMLATEGSRLDPSEQCLVHELNISRKGNDAHKRTVPKNVPQYNSGPSASAASLIQEGVSDSSVIVVVACIPQVPRQPSDRVALVTIGTQRKGDANGAALPERGALRSLNVEMSQLFHPAQVDHGGARDRTAVRRWGFRVDLNPVRRALLKGSKCAAEDSVETLLPSPAPHIHVDSDESCRHPHRSIPTLRWAVPRLGISRARSENLLDPQWARSRPLSRVRSE